jgi:hypothetical protein
MARWRVRLVVTQETQDYADAAVQNLYDCGFNEIEIYSPRGVSIKVDENIASRIKLPRSMTTTETYTSPTTKRIKQKPPQVLESLTYASAISSCTSSFISTTDYMLVIGAELALWYYAPEFLEETIPNERVGMYFPYTPRIFFNAHEYPAPRANEGLIGWSKFHLDEPITGTRCIAGNKHTFMILSKIIEESQGTDMEPWNEEPWDYRFQKTFENKPITCFSATRSLAFRRENISEQEWAIPQDKWFSEPLQSFQLYH